MRLCTEGTVYLARCAAQVPIGGRGLPDLEVVRCSLGDGKIPDSEVVSFSIGGIVYEMRCSCRGLPISPLLSILGFALQSHVAGCAVLSLKAGDVNMCRGSLGHFSNCLRKAIVLIFSS